MTFKVIPGFNERYAVSDTGIVWDNQRGKFKNLRLRKDQYLDVGIDGKIYLVHRLVLMAFKGMPTEGKPLARHLDGSKRNNTPDNLEWGSYIENRADRIAHGTSSTGIGNIGEKCWSSVLKEKDVYEIKHLLSYTKYFDREIAAMYGVNRECINKISRGVRWTHIIINQELQITHNG